MQSLSSTPIIGRSAPTQALLSLIKVLANSHSTVLVTGESGTGKELVAQALHRQSPRRKGPFVPINCGAIPKDLLESELFGHRKGAFTGAVADRMHQRRLTGRRPLQQLGEHVEAVLLVHRGRRGMTGRSWLISRAASRSYRAARAHCSRTSHRSRSGMSTANRRVVAISISPDCRMRCWPTRGDYTKVTYLHGKGERIANVTRQVGGVT